MKTMTNNEHDQSCELIQLSISDAIDSNLSLNREDAQHIESCSECAKFHQLWYSDSPITAIASGSLVEQKNLTQPIIGKLEQNSKIIPLKENNLIRSRLFKLASIAAVIAIVSAISFTHDDVNTEKPDIVEIKTPENTLSLTIPKMNLKLTEAEIEARLEKSLEENYQSLSESATEKWRTATTGIARATEYIADRTHYISNKYLTPKNDDSIGPQSQLAPQLDEQDQLQYG